MIAVIETTKWDWEHQPNHTYLLDGDKIIAYIPCGTTEIRTLKSKMTINRRGRTFRELKVNPFDKVKVPAKNILKIKGSKGNVYEIDLTEKTCSCPGFTYRGKCKHADEHLK
jgi:SWIM zinc finger